MGREREMSRLVPGSFVRHPDRPDWGVGQVQSVIGQRVTVNFENAGKLLINAAVIGLEPIEDMPDDDQP
jgi:transcription elongation factor GreA-like protein